MSSAFKFLLLFLILQTILCNEICSKGDYWTGQKCNACSNLVPGCINCEESTGICITCFANIPPIQVNSSSNITTCTCTTGTLFLYNPSANNYSCGTPAQGNAYYSVSALSAMPANLTLQNLQQLQAAAFGVNGYQAKEKLENISKVIQVFKNYVTSSLSSDILTQLIGCVIGFGQNKNTDFNSLSNLLDITYQILGQTTLTQQQMKNFLEFYGLSIGLVSASTFDYNFARFDPQKIFLQDIQSQFDTLTKQLFQSYTSQSFNNVSMSQSNLRILFQLLNSSTSLQVSLNQYEDTLSFNAQALQLLPNNGSNYLIYATQLSNVQEYSPGISYSQFPFATLNINFYNINQNKITSVNSYFKSLTNQTTVSFIFNANGNSTSTQKQILLEWDTRYLFWDMQEECQFNSNYSKISCQQPNIAEYTLFTVIPYNFSINNCNPGEFLNQDNSCQVCTSTIRNCLFCVGSTGQCSTCEGLIPPIQQINQSNYTYSCSCSNTNEIITYNPTNLSYSCMDSAIAMNTYYDQGQIQAMTQNLTLNDLMNLKAAALAINGANQDDKFEQIISKLRDAEQGTQLYFQFSQVLVGLISNQYLTNYTQVLKLLYLANNIRAKSGINLDAVNQLAEFFGIIIQKVNPNKLSFGSMTQRQIKIFYNSLQSGFESLKQVFIEILPFNPESEYIFHYTNYYLHFAKITNSSDFSSKLMVGNYQVNVKKSIFKQLPNTTIFFSHTQQINNLFEYYSSMNFDGKGFNVNFYYQITATTTTSPRTIRNANSYLTNLQNALEFYGPNNLKFSNLYLAYYSYTKNEWKYLLPECSLQLNNTQISCYPNSLGNSNIFAFVKGTSQFHLNQKVNHKDN